MKLPPDRLLDTPLMIRAEGVTRQVDGPDGQLTILDDIHLEVARGESLAIVGASGSGKSTLLALLAGLDRPQQGRIWIDGQEISALDEDGRARVRAGRVGFVFQAFHLLPALTALENVMLPLELAGRGSEARRLAREALAEVGLGHRTGHYPAQLSGGEQGRVALARAHAGGPGLLFADEPTGNLDRHTAKQVADLMFRLNHEHGTTLVLVTHDESLAERCGRRLHMREGRLEPLAGPTGAAPTADPVTTKGVPAIGSGRPHAEHPDFRPADPVPQRP
jgi:putative ABC transport system ATP-binding protein